MHILRRNKWVLSLIAILALSINTAAGSFCCSPPSGDGARQIYDDVLGWVTICLPSKIAASAQALPATGSNGGHAVHHNCTMHCAAVAALALLYVATALMRLSPPAKPMAYARRRIPRRHFLPEGLGSRAPPFRV